MTLRADSLRFRLLFGTVLWIGLGIVAGGVLVSSLFRWNLLQGYHEELEVHIEELAALTALDRAGQPYLLRRLSDPRYLPSDSGFYWQVDRDGFQTVASPSLGSKRFDPSFANSSRLHFGWIEGPTGKTLEYARQLPLAGGPPLRLLIATDKRLVDATMAEFNRSLFLSLTGFALLMIAAGIVQVRLGLRPLDRLARAIGNVRSGQAERMDGTFPAEVTPLVTDLNSLIESSSASVARSRLIAGNLAHGLRTPLAILVDEADSLRRSGHGAAADTILHEAHKMQQQINFHLARARNAAAQPLPGQSASLRLTFEKLCSAFTRLHLDRGIDFQLDSGEDLQVALDPVDLSEILSNLLDNAGKWAATLCRIKWQRAGRNAVIEIQDDGPGLREDALESVFGVGTRLDDLTPGTGLGLAISRDLARIYGGDVRLGSRLEHGLVVTVTLPLIARQSDQSRLPGQKTAKRPLASPVTRQD